jgi:hypothetical protein
MGFVITRVRVEDFHRYWQTFSGRGLEKRRAHGCRGARVFRVEGEPGEVRVLFDWDREGFEAFMADPEAPEIMAEAGLEGHPQPTFLEHAGDLDA